MNYEDIVAELINGRNLSEADRRIIGAFAFASMMREKAQQEVLDGDQDAAETEQAYAREMRSWADKRKDLFGDDQVVMQSAVTDEEKKKKEMIEDFKKNLESL